MFAVGVAQLVELQVVALAVAGSNPVPHPNYPGGGGRAALPALAATERVWRNW
jgi:hypothetical protein